MTFKSVLHGVARRMGLDPEVDLLASQAAALTENIEARLREYWEAFDWPELLVYEERAATSLVVPWEDTGKTPMGEAFGVWNADPRATSAAKEIAWSYVATGILLAVGSPATVWVCFRSRPPSLSSEDWDAATAYVVGDLAYQASDGEIYRCIQNNTNHAPPSASYWTKVDFPYVLAPCVRQGAYADALRGDGQNDKARSEEQRADDLLVREMDKVGLQGGLVRRYRATRG